ncbi:hypothetical protein AU467_16710 [Mesorhizobium loti]|uniref:Uncharacterized protein n=1 Tax=Rhizobium loti TaxID=381 RepID=A0A101KV49_RHILI|nr:hypothetical protein AU467_16710 [Mesorhizobium loti]
MDERVGGRDGSFAIGIVVGKDRVIVPRYHALTPNRRQLALVHKFLHEPTLEQGTITGPDGQDDIGRPFSSDHFTMKGRLWRDAAWPED